MPHAAGTPAPLLLLLALLPPLLLGFLYQTELPSTTAAAAAFGGGLILAFFVSCCPRGQSAGAAEPTRAPTECASNSCGRSASRHLSRLPLSGQISADYAEPEDGQLRGAGDLPARLFRVARQPANPTVVPAWSCAEWAAERAATDRLTGFSWTLPRWSRCFRSLKQLESPEFADPLMPGVTWRCQLRREGRRFQVLVKAARLEPAEFLEGRLFAELTCACGGVAKSTFGAFYPGVFEFALGLDDPAVAASVSGSAPSSLTVACTVSVLVTVPVHLLPPLPPACQTDGQGRYVSCHPAGVRWQLADWHRLAWRPGEAAFSPLFCCASLPGWLWQVHLYPASDEPSTAGQASVFLKLVDAAGPGAGPLEADFELSLVPGVADFAAAPSSIDGLFDTVEFARGDAHGFRGVAPLRRLRCAGPLLVECALRMKIPLFT